jgi:GNAT superfamily N-acetyltransferase
MIDSDAVLAAVARSDQAYARQLTEREPFDFGVAYRCADYPQLPDANQCREVLFGSTPPDVVLKQITDHYQAHQLRCLRWVAAADQPDEALGDLLRPHGYRRREFLAMGLARQVNVPGRDEVRIVPARAMRAALSEVLMANERFAESVCTMRAEALGDRLDDPRLEVFVALLDDRPAGCAGLMEVGDIGRIKELFVAPGCRRTGVGRSLLRHVLRLTRRLALQQVCLQISADSTVAIALFEQCGFEPAGTLVQFDVE